MNIDKRINKLFIEQQKQANLFGILKWQIEGLMKIKSERELTVNQSQALERYINEAKAAVKKIKEIDLKMQELSKNGK